MNEITKAPRELKERIYAVDDGSGRRAFYRATSSTQAKAFHNDDLTVRQATIDEMIEIGQRGLAVGGFDAPTAVDTAQIDAFPQE